MAFRGRTKEVAPKTTSPRSLIASAAAVDFKLPMWPTHYGVDNGWQTELWRLYDCVPEFSRGANWIGQACSRVRLYVAEVNENGEVQREVKPGSRIGKVGASLLGGPERQPDLLRLAGTSMIVSGEFWILGLSVDGDEDKWFVVQPNELRQLENFLSYPEADPLRQFVYDTGNTRYELREGRDIVFRVWTPHPNFTACADSPGRTLQMTLVELEILSQYILAQARSRLASGGVWPWPASAEQPSDDSQPVNADSLMQRMLDAAKANLTNYGSAAQLVPIIVEMPIDVFDKIKDPIMFGTILSEQAMKLREENRSVVAHGLEIPPEIITGMGDSTHWNGPMIDQSGVDTAVVPILTRIVNALTEIILVPWLKINDPKNVKKYRVWFDTAALVNRPNRLKETLELYQQGIVSLDEVLKAADLPESAKMSEDEALKEFVKKLMLSDTNLLQIKGLRDLAGIKIKDFVPDAPPIQPMGQPGIAGRAPAPPPPARTLKNINPTSSPQESTLPGAPNNAVPGPQNRQPAAMTASAHDQLALVVGADTQVRQALEKVGKVLRRGPGGARFREIPEDQIYLHLEAQPEQVFNLLNNSFGYLDPIMEHLNRADSAEVRSELINYCYHLIINQQRHEPRLMRGALERAALL